MKRQEATPRAQALACAKAEAGPAIASRLRALGGGNPAGGVDIILGALVDVQTPGALIGALLEIGARRLKQQ